jgi:hypothetical protein
VNTLTQRKCSPTEFSWRRIKHDFLHHFHAPRCDLLAWILVTKLAPSYYRKLDRLLVDTGRYRELPSWRKCFKSTWRKLEKKQITLPLNAAYKPDTKKWVCTCPSFATSRFLLCKHLVQAVHTVPPIFYLEARRQRTSPFWVHETLKPLNNDDSDTEQVGQAASQDNIDTDTDIDDDDDDDGEIIDTQPAGGEGGLTFEETMGENISIIEEFTRGLTYQIQFRDERMLRVLEREGASFLRLARVCLSKEKRMKSSRASTPATWEKSTSNAMFYRVRPIASD